MKILVVRLSSLGDILHAFPAVSDLRRRYPDAQIHWLVEPAFAEMAGWHAAVDKVITVPLRAHKKTWWKLPALLAGLRRQLRAERYDIVLDAQGLLKSALLARLAGAEVFGFSAGSAREPLAARFYRKAVSVPSGLHIIDKNRQLVGQLFAADISQPADFGLARFRAERMQAELPQALGALFTQPCIVLLHGTTWSSKYWPEASWAELIRLLAEQGWRCLLPWGNQEEYQLARRLKGVAEQQVEVLPRLSLTDLMGVLLHAQGFVSVESGIGHLAAALDIPGLMLHGPTDPSYSGILGKACQHLTSGLYCSPCFKRDCPRIDTPADIPPCQQAVVVERVYGQFIQVNSGRLPRNDKMTPRKSCKFDE